MGSSVMDSIGPSSRVSGSTSNWFASTSTRAVSPGRKRSAFMTSLAGSGQGSGAGVPSERSATPSPARVRSLPRIAAVGGTHDRRARQIAAITIGGCNTEAPEVVGGQHKFKVPLPTLMELEEHGAGVQRDRLGVELQAKQLD